jgi:CrcB protein
VKVFIAYVWVGVGGFAGAIARYFVANVCGRTFGTAFPVGTAAVNLIGCFFLGWFLTVVGQRVIVSDALRLAVATGFIGAFTTFSTYMYESNGLFEDGSGIKAMINILGSIVLGLLAVRLGMMVAMRH